MQYVSEGCKDLTGYEAESLQGRDGLTFARVIHPDDRPAVRAAVKEALASGESYRVTYRIVTADGAEKWVWEQGALADGDQDDEHLEGLILDVDDRARAERQIQETLRKLEQSNAELEQFAYVASHDLREPLRAIGGYLKLLQRRYGDDLPEEAGEFMDFAQDGAGRMQKMIDDLLAYSRVDTRGERPAPTDLNQVVDRVLHSLSVAIQENDATVEVGELPVSMADSAQMERVLQNLLSNALKYRGEATPVVKVESEDRDRLWCIRVCDNGVGLPEDQRERVFRIFQRAHSRNEYPGTGMGLAICRKIVERHGGRIWLEDSPLGGICVAFTLPKVREAAPQPEPQKV